MTPAGKYPCDMHCHTVRSDGNDTPLELIHCAKELKLHAIGVTDHDITPPLTVVLEDGSEVDSIEYAQTMGIILIPGYEFSCDTWVDDVHICGYNLDWNHPDINSEVTAASQSKIDGYEQLCHRLTDIGMPLDWDTDILSYKDSNGGLKTRKPEEVQRKHVFEAMAEKEYTASWSDAKILVRDNPNLNVKRRKIDPCDAIRLIHRCNGIAILAHPYLIDETVTRGDGSSCSRAEYIDALITAGLDGIEASYTYDKTSYKGTSTPETIEKEVREEYSDKVRFISGGSDYHADHKKNSKKIRYLGERGISVAEFEHIFQR